MIFSLSFNELFSIRTSLLESSLISSSNFLSYSNAALRTTRQLPALCTIAPVTGFNNPSTLHTIATALMHMDNAILNLIVNNVEFERRLRYGILPMSSPKSATSAASIATSLPMVPMATLTSDALRAGASFTPSPIIHTWRPDFLMSSIAVSLSSGSNSPLTSLIPTFDAK